MLTSGNRNAVDLQFECAQQKFFNFTPQAFLQCIIISAQGNSEHLPNRQRQLWNLVEKTVCFQSCFCALSSRRSRLMHSTDHSVQLWIKRAIPSKQLCSKPKQYPVTGVKQSRGFRIFNTCLLFSFQRNPCSADWDVLDCFPTHMQA